MLQFPDDNEYTSENVESGSEQWKDFKKLAEELHVLFINSDAEECNANLSKFLKTVVDNLYIDKKNHDSIYERVSLLAFKFLESNLFLRNYEFCIAKLMSLLVVFAEQTSHSNQQQVTNKEDDIIYQTNCYKELVCIIILLMLKMRNGSPQNHKLNPSHDRNSLSIDDLDLTNVFRNIEIVKVMSSFISAQITAIDVGMSSLIILKFSCNILFEYLYFCELMVDEEFDILQNDSCLVSTLVKALLTNENFHNYDLDGDYFEDEEKMIAYEELKLLLLLNEQFLMKSYSSQNTKNIVFQYLLDVNTDNDGQINSRFTLFANLLVYHLNREESQIVKILILKFLYLVFTTSFTTTALYTNDLKILVDIIIRELNNIDCYSLTDYGSKVLYIAYLKVLYPLLKFSQLNDVPGGYKIEEVTNVLRNIILNPIPINETEASDGDLITKLATKCLDIPWLKKSLRSIKKSQDLKNDSQSESSYSPSPSTSTSNLLMHDNKDLTALDNSSTSSLNSVFTRVPSIRASSRADLNKRASLYDSFGGLRINETTKFEQNNHNVFMNHDIFDSSSNKHGFKKISDRTSQNYSDAEPINYPRNQIASGIGANTKSKKKIPPPPPPPPRRKFKIKSDFHSN